MKRVKDPVHDHIVLDRLALALVDRPELQRLRRVRQTGTAHLVYPGANHTRFEHSLGASHLAGLAVEALDLPKDERACVTAAALLHDVGHGPFSHISEPILERHTKRSHEDVSAALVRGPLADVLSAHGVDPNAVAALVLGRHPLRELISGPLDVDRIDYLLRDGHYTGVATSVDAVRLVTHLVRHPGGIALRSDAVGAAETFLVTRFAMHAAVYNHHTCRGGELLLERAMEAAIEAGRLDPERLPAMDDTDLVALLRACDGTPSALMRRIDERRLYKVAYGVRFRDLQSRFLSSVAGHRVRLRAIAEEIAARVGAPADDVLVDVPPLPTVPEVDAPVLGPDGALRRLAESSTLVAALARASMDHLHLRVYAPPRLREAIAREAPKVAAIERPLDEFSAGPG